VTSINKSADEHKIPAIFVYAETTVFCDFIKACESCDSCLKLSKFKALKMLDLQTKSSINSNNLQV
jgi:hypothetical protein